MNVVFPKVAGGLPRRSMFERYYDIYYRFHLNTLKHIGANIKFTGDTSIGDARYTMELDGQPMAIDYSVHLDMAPNYKRHEHYFKTHYSEGVHDSETNMHAFSPISFYDWGEYFELEKKIEYTAKTDLILNRQRPHLNALKRRSVVQAKLRQHYGKQVAIDVVSQQEFWQNAADCLVSVCVPGSRNDMLDRGHIQYLGLGVCTISPYLINYLPGGGTMEPGVHYVKCADDYSDLVDTIEWCRNNRDACVEIGRNAKKLFMERFTPEPLWAYVREMLSKN